VRSKNTERSEIRVCACAPEDYTEAALGRGRGKRLGFVSLVALATATGGCNDFDTSRTPPARGSLGREMYTMVCDRVGAQALREDVTGASYHDVCHAAADGSFVDQVDAEKLPPLDPEALDVDGKPVSMDDQAAHRAHRIARIEALARRRADLIDAFDTAFANEVIATKDLGNADPTKTCDPPPGDQPGEADLRTELASMLGRLTDLYDDDTIPHVTRGLSRVMDDFQRSPDAQAALARFDARVGYRPADVAQGVAQPALSYPRFPELANALLRLLASDTDPLGLTLPPDAPRKKPADRTAADRIPGPAHAPLVKLLEVAQEELANAQAIPDLPPLTTAQDSGDPYLLRLSRPRGNLEMTRAILLASDPAFSIGDPKWTVARDFRGVAKVAVDGSGKLPAPFVDATGPGGKPDGLPDIDDLGRFVTTGTDAPTPFLSYGAAPAGVTRDASGKVKAYDYIDVSSTYLASFSRDLVPLLEPDVTKKHETIMDLLAGLYAVAGEREKGMDSVRKYADGQSVQYRAIKEDNSPLLDLVYAVGQVFADPTTDDTLALLQRLAQDRPDLLARMIGMGLSAKAIADKHPEAHIPDKSTLWDEMLDVLVEISQQPGLIEAIIRAFQDDAVLDLPRSAVAYMTMRDHLQYDRNDLNGAPYNLTTSSVGELVTPVDRSKADTGWNRSAFQRFLQVLHETNGMSTCTKEGAVAHIVWKGLPMDFPSFTASAACVVLGSDSPPDPMPVCGMFRVENIAANLVDAVLGTVQLDIRNDCLKNLVSSPLTGIVGGADAFLEEISGVKGWNLHPTVAAVDRMVFFDLPHDGLPGDTQNSHTENFFKDLFDPATSLVCPAFPFTDTDGHVLNLRQCGSFQDSLRGRDLDALFPIETMGFLASSKPLARAFHDHGGNLLFVKLFDRLAVHWGSDKQDKSECDPSHPKTDAIWCGQDGAVTYEPLVAEILGKTDLFQTLHDGAKDLATIKVPHCDARDDKGVCTKKHDMDGVQVLAAALESMVDPKRNVGLKQRNGDAGVARNDGTKNAQVTPIYLLIDALVGFDHSFTGENAARLPQWRSARSQLVDQLFAVDGTGKDSKFHNPATQKSLPTLIGTLRSQIAAHCTDSTCAWARHELPDKAKNVILGPTFASTLDVLDAIRQDEGARTELERLLQFLLLSAQGDAQKATLTALVDLLQVFEDDKNLTALLHAASQTAGPEVIGDDGKVASRGLVLASIEALARILGEAHAADGTRLCGKEIDPNRTLAVVLRRLVTPPPPNPDGTLKQPPIEVLIDAMADVNRRHPESSDKLTADDYASIAFEISDFCSNPTRGLEQVYTVIKQATKDL
jgi:hypothetical protein